MDQVLGSTPEGVQDGLNDYQVTIGFMLDEILAPVDFAMDIAGMFLNLLDRGMNFLISPDGDVRESPQVQTAARGSILVMKYNKLRLPSSIYQRNHLNQTAAWRDIIPREQGVCVPMTGNIHSPGTEHFEFHLEMERFWERYRRTSTKPTVCEYNKAVGRALQAAGATRQQAAALVRATRAEQMRHGFLSGMEVPGVPKLIQALKRFL